MLSVDNEGITPFRRAIRVKSEQVVIWYMSKMTKEMVKIEMLNSWFQAFRNVFKRGETERRSYLPN